jgi:hypothetical protein
VRFLYLADQAGIHFAILQSNLLTMCPRLANPNRGEPRLKTQTPARADLAAGVLHIAGHRVEYATCPKKYDFHRLGPPLSGDLLLALYTRRPTPSSDFYPF